jgi:5S rRNA maturation endonuclease (ribonuclease M5)
VLDAVGLTPRDLFDDPQGARYEYPDGRTVLRTPDKRFTQRGNTKGRKLFHADLIDDAQLVYVVEGEKDVLAVEAAGNTAVCSAMGAGKAKGFDWSPLSGRRVIIVADRDEPGPRHAAAVAKLLDGKASAVQIREAAVGKDVADHLAAGKRLVDLVPAEQTSQIVMATTRLADVQPERVSWLWPNRIPVGKLVTLDGDPGLGKSTLAIDIAAIVTTAGRWPDGTTCAYSGAVLLMSAEDGLADTTRPRADAAGADVTKVHAIDGVHIAEDGTLRPPTLGDVAGIEEAITRTGARLLVIDVVMAYLPTGTDAHKDQDIRRVLSRLAAVADRTGCTVLLLRHLNKAKGGDPLYRGGGSIGIVGAARAGLLVASDPDDPERRVLASVKSNLGPAPDSLAYRLVGAGDHGVARVQWEGHTDHTAHSLLAEPRDEDKGATTEAEQWLQDYLTEQGAASSKTAKADAAKAGIRERTLQRAVKSLGVAVESRGFPRVTWWSPHSGANDDNSAPASQNLGATGATGDDLHKQCGVTGPNLQSRQRGETGATDTPTPPGGLSPHSPGQTERVREIVARASARRYPTCAVCGEAMVAGQGETHLSCQVIGEAS